MTAATKDMIDESFINRMKEGSSLVNTAGGKIVKDIDIFYEKREKTALNAKRVIDGLRPINIVNGL